MLSSVVTSAPHLRVLGDLSGESLRYPLATTHCPLSTLSPFPATLTRRRHSCRKTASVSPLPVTLTDTPSRKRASDEDASPERAQRVEGSLLWPDAFPCHSYENTGGVPQSPATCHSLLHHAFPCPLPLTPAFSFSYRPRRVPRGSLPCSTQSPLTPFLSCVCGLFSSQRRGTPSLSTRLSRAKSRGHSSLATKFLRMNTSIKYAYNSFRMNTCKTQDLKSFRMNTYEKHRGVGDLIVNWKSHSGFLSRAALASDEWHPTETFFP